MSQKFGGGCFARWMERLFTKPNSESEATEKSVSGSMRRKLKKLKFGWMDFFPAKLTTFAFVFGWVTSLASRK